MSKNDRDFDIDVKNHFRCEAGQDSPYGKVSYRVLTNNGSGLSFHEDGLNKENLQVAVSGRSVECLGSQIKRKRDAAQDPMVPAKYIKCKHGDVVIDCDDGDIILKADNIVMEAKGLTANCTPCPIVDGEVVYCMSGYKGYSLLAIPITGN